MQLTNNNRLGASLVPSRSTGQNILVERYADTDSSMLQDETHGVALKAAKDKWNELGPLRLDDIMANS